MDVGHPAAGLGHHQHAAGVIPDLLPVLGRRAAGAGRPRPRRGPPRAYLAWLSRRTGSARMARRSAMRAASPWEEWAASTDSQKRMQAGSAWSLTLTGTGSPSPARGTCQAPAPRMASEHGAVAAVAVQGGAQVGAAQGRQLDLARRGSGPGPRRTAGRAGSPWCRRWGRGSRSGARSPWRRPGRSRRRRRRRRPRRAAARTWPTTRSRMAAFAGSRRAAASSSPITGSSGKASPRARHTRAWLPKSATVTGLRSFFSRAPRSRLACTSRHRRPASRTAARAVSSSGARA